ncbi:MAG: DNA polymerase III subunit delta [Planctomycetes bacterium]|nr:DNA polymerase III subunit delta [Planctomycetota bacterium]MBU1517404.1 DNA polymerase III subunit delta [Planctomycetota bacterium]MBU2457764.1 DNA polymerase III subunit delta [Planctomycetota bacterium]MBU2597421.1 DNA polymerase III subunit delta [Planctomycetota bacterium]
MPIIGKKQTRPIYVIAGKNEFLVAEEVTALVNQLLTPEQMQMCLWKAEADKVSAAEVFDDLRTLPFLAERRVVVLSGADDFVSSNRELLEKYFESPAASGVLILSVSKWPSNTRLAKALPKVGQLIEVGELKSRELVSYITDYAKQQHSKNLSYNAGQMLVEFAGNEPGVLRCEVDKLAAYTASAKAITEKDISELVGRNRVFGAFEVIDSMTAGDTGRALEKLRMMFGADKTAEYTVVGAFAWHFRRMFTAYTMLKDSRPDEVARKLRVWNQKQFFDVIRKMTLKRIGDCLRQLAEIDYQIKTGRATAQTAIESMIVELAGK